jgi:putative ABC transport system ATP-binding protein/lipoprotein-releasing system ATP-binding protein
VNRPVLLEAQHLARTFRVAGRPLPAVHDASLIVRAGESVSIVGHSGSGKSTFLAMAGGILRPGAGRVLLEGDDLWDRDDDERSRLRNARISFVYQFASLMPTLTAEENVLLPKLFGGSASLDDAERMLELVGLSDRLGHYPREMSGGEQQRVAIARALITKPRVILADEPTGDLDEQTESVVMDVLERYVREHQASLIMVTHSRDLAGRAARQCLMKHGLLEER